MGAPQTHLFHRANFAHIRLFGRILVTYIPKSLIFVSIGTSGVPDSIFLGAPHTHVCYIQGYFCTYTSRLQCLFTELFMYIYTYVHTYMYIYTHTKSLTIVSIEPSEVWDGFFLGAPAFVISDDTNCATTTRIGSTQYTAIYKHI